MKNEEIITAIAVSSWKQVVGRLDQMLASTSEEDLQKQVAPGRNRILYLVGHLTVAHDRLFPMLGLGDRLHPELDAEFFGTPDRHTANDISSTDLRKAWAEVNSKLTAAFEALRPEE